MVEGDLSASKWAIEESVPCNRGRYKPLIIAKFDFDIRSAS